MKDSKLTSKDLVKIRIAFGGSDKATTQTARIARKLAEKTKKRNKIGLTVIHSDPGFGSGQQMSHLFGIKKGGKVIAAGDMRYDVLKGDKNTRGLGFIEVGSITSRHPSGEFAGYDQEASSKFANKTLKPREVKTALKLLGKRFPSARHVSGYRETGAKAGNSVMQKIRLPDPNKVLKRASRGAGGLATAALESGFTTYAQGGSASGAALSAGATTGAGAGIAAAIKRLGSVAATHAPGAARIAGRAAPGLMLASAGYDVGRTVLEGYRAHEAAEDRRRNEAYMNENYGSIEAATQTRRRRTGGR